MVPANNSRSHSNSFSDQEVKNINPTEFRVTNQGIEKQLDILGISLFKSMTESEDSDTQALFNNTNTNSIITEVKPKKKKFKLFKEIKSKFKSDKNKKKLLIDSSKTEGLSPLFFEAYSISRASHGCFEIKPEVKSHNEEEAIGKKSKTEISPCSSSFSEKIYLCTNKRTGNTIQNNNAIKKTDKAVFDVIIINNAMETGCKAENKIEVKSFQEDQSDFNKSGSASIHYVISSSESEDHGRSREELDLNLKILKS